MLGLLQGSASGIWMVLGCKISIDRNQGLIQIPAQYRIFILFLLIFGLAFTIHFIQGAHLPLANNPMFHLAIAIITGTLVGLSSGRNLYYLQQSLGGSAL